MVRDFQLTLSIDYHLVFIFSQILWLKKLADAISALIFTSLKFSVARATLLRGINVTPFAAFRYSLIWNYLKNLMIKNGVQFQRFVIKTLVNHSQRIASAHDRLPRCVKFFFFCVNLGIMKFSEYNSFIIPNIITS